MFFSDWHIFSVIRLHCTVAALEMSALGHIIYVQPTRKMHQQTTKECLKCSVHHQWLFLKMYAIRNWTSFLMREAAIPPKIDFIPQKYVAIYMILKLNVKKS